MDEKMLYQSVPCNEASLDVKRIMNKSVADAKRLYGLLKKQIAIELEIPEAVLSRWLSMGPNADGHTIWAHKVRPFCEITRDWTLARFLAPKRRRVA